MFFYCTACVWLFSIAKNFYSILFTLLLRMPFLFCSFWAKAKETAPIIDISVRLWSHNWKTKGARIDHEIISTVILTILLIQEVQLSVTEDPYRVSNSFVEIDHEIFSTVILSLQLIQEGSCQFLAKEYAQYLLTP